MTDTKEEAACGAASKDWLAFALVHDVSDDILPVVSRKNCIIASYSKLSNENIHKTPSRYNAQGEAVGIGNWTQYRATDNEIESWMRQPDYGVSVICRRIKAIDIDIEDPILAQDVADAVQLFFEMTTGRVAPVRSRPNSGKRLLMYRVEAPTLKRVIKTEPGMVEVLGDRQQFIAAGTHPSGVRYEWDNLESTLPEITADDERVLVELLCGQFGVGPVKGTRESTTPTEPRARQDFDTREPIYQRLLEQNRVASDQQANGGFNIICPNSGEHTEDTDGTSSTQYFPRGVGGFDHPSIVCLHAHCKSKNQGEWKEMLFPPIEDFDIMPPLQEKKLTPGENPFKFVNAVDFANTGENPQWLVRKLIPMGGIGMIYGPPSSGKTFAVLDLVAAIARGEDWQGYQTKKGRALYICGEGKTFFRNRIKAYLTEHKLDGLDMDVLAAQPNLMELSQCKALVAAAMLGDDPAVLVIDTYATCMQGDENSSVDASKVISNCQYIQQKLGCALILVHHSGKDLARGARGWSGMHAAMDFEFSVAKNKDASGVREFKVVKQKDGPDDLVPLRFRLRTVQIGEELDDLGIPEPVEACVFERAEDTLDPAPNGEKKGLAAVGVNEVRDAVGVKAITAVDALDEILVQRGFHEIKARDAAREALRSGFDAQVAQLIKSGLIGQAGDFLTWEGGAERRG